jgi:hypothetical protein
MREWARRGGRRSDVCLESEEVPGQHDEILHCAAMLVVGTVFSLVDERSQKSDVGHMLAKKPAEPLAGPVEIARVVETASEREQLIEGDRHGVGLGHGSTAGARARTVRPTGTRPVDPTASSVTATPSTGCGTSGGVATSVARPAASGAILPAYTG